MQSDPHVSQLIEVHKGFMETARQMGDPMAEWLDQSWDLIEEVIAKRMPPKLYKNRLERYKVNAEENKIIRDRNRRYYRETPAELAKWGL